MIAARRAGAGSLRLSVAADWLVCQEECIPEKASLQPHVPRTYHSSCYRQLPPQQPVNCQPIDVL